MKKIGIRIPLLLILVVVLIVGSASPVSAAREKGYVTITKLDSGEIDFDYGWDKIWAYGYRILVVKINDKVILSEYYHFDGDRKKGIHDGINIDEDDITSGDYQVSLFLYNKFGKLIKRGIFVANRSF